MKNIIMVLCLLSFNLLSREMYSQETISGPDQSYGLVILKNINMSDYRKAIFFANKTIISSPDGQSFYCELSNGRSKKEKIKLYKGSNFVFNEPDWGYYSWQGALFGRIWRKYWLIKSNDSVQFFSCINHTKLDLNYKLIKSAVGSYLKLTRI